MAKHKAAGTVRLDGPVLKKLHALAATYATPPAKPPPLSDVVKLALDALEEKRKSIHAGLSSAS